MGYGFELINNDVAYNLGRTYSFAPDSDTILKKQAQVLFTLYIVITYMKMKTSLIFE